MKTLKNYWYDIYLALNIVVGIASLIFLAACFVTGFINIVF